MQVTPTVGSPPAGRGVPEGFGAGMSFGGADRFFALIQSFFASRPESASIREPRQGSEVEARHEEGTSCVAERADDGTDPARGTGARKPRSVREAGEARKADGESPAEEAAPEDPETAPVDGGGIPAEVEQPVREVVARLRKLLASLEDGLSPGQGMDALMRILALLHQMAMKLGKEDLGAFFRAMGPELEGLMAKAQELVVQLEQDARLDNGQGHVTGLGAKRRQERAETIRELVQSLAEILSKAVSRVGPKGPPEIIPLEGDAEIQPIQDVAPIGPAPAVEAEQEEGAGEQAGGDGEAAPGARRGVSRRLAAAAPADGGQGPAKAGEGADRPQIHAAALRPVAAVAEPAAAGLTGGAGRTVGEAGRPSPVAQQLARAPLSLRADQVAAFERILKAAQMSKWEGGGRFQIRLAPPQLGNLRMDLTVRDGILTGKLHVETPAARLAVVQQVESLKSALSEQGLEVGSFQVSVDAREQEPRDGRDEERPATAQALSVEPTEILGKPEDPVEADRSTYMDVRA